MIYMKRFSIKNALIYIIPIVLFALMLSWVIVSLTNTSRSAGRQEMAAVKGTIENGITMCYAIEGAYPPSLEYLSENYGITYDTAKYVVRYDRFADNVRPTVRVVERNGGAS